ncbi:membrane protein [Adhaeribacter aerolatus]|uniref:Membrane protein n=1 Tax=Adhaeribacter aerolatus TaxID=670289 RepID=A0A512B3B7_9BACT|nr:RagB/SusD family nutrient uptake outer membrane protein [Adhaeribacter aerolatus]GEO06456.1 membrane protein [Adhaeribacter aerolatus]
MKSIKYITPIVLLLSLLACKEEQLDLYPKISLTEGNFYKTESQFIQAVNDVYRQMRVIYNAQGIADLFGELRSDNTFIKIAAGGGTNSIDISEFKLRTDNPLVATAWANCYNAIFICNNAIEQLDKTTVVFQQPELKERLKAEAIFVRSLIYFNMVRAWGEVPLVLSVVTAEQSYSYLRESKDAVYKQIIGDLIYCKNTLPEKYTGTNIGRTTKFGATAVLAKIYLTIGDKANAEKELREIVNSNLYSLDANGNGTINTDDYNFNFQPNTKNSKESVLEVQYLAGVNAANSNHQELYAPWHFAFHLPGSTENLLGQGFNTPTEDITNEFESKDPRKVASVNPGFVNLTNNQSVDYPWTPKFFDPTWRNPGQNFEIIRYADILLMLSEVTEDPTYLNMVRARVVLPGFGQPGYPAQYNTLAKALEHERRVELAFEFHRFFDLVRTGRAIEVMKAKGYNINQDNILFPIPLSTIDVNPKITQNPGYN